MLRKNISNHDHWISIYTEYFLKNVEFVAKVIGGSYLLIKPSLGGHNRSLNTETAKLGYGFM